jgi:hypothetical protein
MANRSYQQPLGSIEVNMVELYGSILVGASGAVTSFTGAATVVKNATAGNYTITLDDRFYKLFSVRALATGPAATGVVPSAELVVTPATKQASFQTSGAVTIQFYDYAGVAANLTSGSEVTFSITVRNSSVGA